jgi:NitT/TauT family transport system substrate-binding protein
MKNMWVKKLAGILAVGVLIGLIHSGAHAAPDIRFGTLPVLQALPVFVAAEKGFFKEQGITVELVSFGSAFEKDVAFTSGQISGYFGDILTCMVLNANKVPIKIVSVVHNATRAQRMFALVISSKYVGKDPKEAFSTGIAVSSNTVLDYLTTKFLASKGIPLSQAKMVEIKNIPIRLQMLATGQVPAAVLPEPLATLAEMKGAKALMDDAGTGWSATILAFSDTFLAKNPEKVKAFQKAIDKASAYINKNPEDVRPIMNRECRIPDQLKQNFPIPQFPKLALPLPNQVGDVSQWLVQKRTIKKEVAYAQTVADGFIP